jgi:serine acetyltransferase
LPVNLPPELLVFARILTGYARKAGISVPRRCNDVPLLIDHGTGLSLARLQIIGKYVGIYQELTLGALPGKHAGKKATLQ